MADEEFSTEEDVLSRGVQNHQFTNWAETFSCTPEFYFEPETEDEIKKVTCSSKRVQTRQLTSVKVILSVSSLFFNRSSKLRQSYVSGCEL